MRHLHPVSLRHPHVTIEAPGDIALEIHYTIQTVRSYRDGHPLRVETAAEMDALRRVIWPWDDWSVDLEVRWQEQAETVLRAFRHIADWCERQRTDPRPAEHRHLTEDA